MAILITSGSHSRVILTTSDFLGQARRCPRLGRINYTLDIRNTPRGCPFCRLNANPKTARKSIKRNHPQRASRWMVGNDRVSLPEGEEAFLPRHSSRSGPDQLGTHSLSACGPERHSRRNGYTTGGCGRRQTRCVR
jgi:hypothetical protein